MGDDVLYTNKEMIDACRNTEAGLSDSNADVMGQDSFEERERLALFDDAGLAKMALRYAETMPDSQAADLLYVIGKRLAT